MNIKNCHIIWLAVAVALTALILWLALMPGESVPSGLGWDKLNHVAAIAAVTVAVYLALSPGKRAAESAFLYGMLLGVLIEILQGTMTASRTAEWSDLLADLVGASAVWVAIKIYQSRITPEI